MTSENRVEVRVAGRSMWVPSAYISGRRVIATGKSLKLAAVMDEELVDGETVPDPELFVSQLQHSPLQADIFTFAQKMPDITPKHPYRLEWDTAAVIPMTTYADWWEKRAEYDVRKAVKRAKRLGVVVRPAAFDDVLVEGIRCIYNESPVRQGKPFWHYQKNFDDVKRECATYLERSTFIGAYYNDELIGFIKMVRVGTIATTLHVISQKGHFDKKPTNALIAKAIEICELDRVSHFVYGDYDSKSSLTEFKRRNGFEQALVPRYYIPLTLRGKIALQCNLHHHLTALLPERLRTFLRKARSVWYHRKPQSAADPA